MRKTMTDKLQEVVERFIAEKQFSVLEAGKLASECKSMCIDVADLRAFLAQYVLCEREVVAHAAFSHDGNIRMWCKSQEEAIRNAGYEPFPLHAPAKEPKP